MMNRPMIFVDCDGVLRALIDKVLTYHGLDDFAWPKGVYDVSIATGLSAQTFWDVPLEAWTEAAPYHNAHWLLRRCTEIGDTYILTGCLHPSWTKQWLANQFPWFRLKDVIFCQHKVLLARDVRRWLIDDSAAECEEWEAAGGFAYNWPRPWNWAKMTDDPVADVIQMIEEW